MGNIIFTTTCTKVNFTALTNLLKEAGMAYRLPEEHKQAFENSAKTIFAFDEETLIGCGRALSDGVYQAVLYDIAVLPQYQGKALGRMIMEHLTEGLRKCNVILYATPGKEGFYRKFGFRKLQSGMGAFIHAQQMQERGFTD